MADLKPCPFCGDNNLTFRWEGQPAQRWAVKCYGCGGTTEAHRPVESVAGTIMEDLPGHKAIAAWNRRAPDERDQVIRGLMEAGQSALDHIYHGEIEDTLRAALAEARKLMGEGNG